MRMNQVSERSETAEAFAVKVKCVLTRIYHFMTGAALGN